MSHHKQSCSDTTNPEQLLQQPRPLEVAALLSLCWHCQSNQPLREPRAYLGKVLTGIRTSFLFHSQTSSALDFRGLGGCAGPRAGWEGLDCDPRDKINSAHVPSATVDWCSKTKNITARDIDALLQHVLNNSEKLMYLKRGTEFTDLYL